MSARKSKEEHIKDFISRARERWGEKEAKQLEPALRRVAEAVWEVEGFSLEPEDESTTPPGDG
jgi:hypothetical protein